MCLCLLLLPTTAVPRDDTQERVIEHTGEDADSAVVLQLDDLLEGCAAVVGLLFRYGAEMRIPFDVVVHGAVEEGGDGAVGVLGEV